MKEYTHKIRKGLTIPWGYRQDENDPQLLVPIPEQLDLLKEAEAYLKTGNYSQREVARWISAASGRYISHVGLKKRIKTERSEYFREMGRRGYQAALKSRMREDGRKKVEDDEQGSASQAEETSEEARG